MQPILIDTHAHIYLPQFDDDRATIVSNAKAAGVTSIYLPAVDSSTHEAMLQTEAAYPFCKSMMGVHPCSVKEDYQKEIGIAKDHLMQRRFVAIGEIGLDFYWDTTFARQQYEAFHQQIELAITYNLPIVIHSRNAIDECIEVVAKYPAVRGIFHCFSGNLRQAENIMAMDFLLGIGGVVTFKNGGLDKVLPQIGLSHIVLETDAPYLAPVPHRGKRNEPAYTKLVAEKLASLLNLEVTEVAAATTENSKNLFGIKENH